MFDSERKDFITYKRMLIQLTINSNANTCRMYSVKVGQSHLNRRESKRYFNMREAMRLFAIGLYRSMGFLLAREE